MRSTRVPIQEQYRLIMECRQSGLTDHQWCLEHDIKPGTFYNWVKRLRQKGCTELPAATGRSYNAETKQEVIKVDFKNPSVYAETKGDACNASDANYSMPISDSSAMKLTVGNCILSIPNGTDPVLLAQTLKVFMEFSC